MITGQPSAQRPVFADAARLLPALRHAAPPNGLSDLLQFCFNNHHDDSNRGRPTADWLHEQLCAIMA